MNGPYNPYAAPRAAPPPILSPAAPGIPQSWTIADVLSIAWGSFTRNWPVLTFTLVLYTAITGTSVAYPENSGGAPG